MRRKHNVILIQIWKNVLPWLFGGLLSWNFKQILVALLKMLSFFCLFCSKAESLRSGEIGDMEGPKTEGNSVLIMSPESWDSSTFSGLEDSCKYWGSNIQNPPFPGSSFVRLIFLKHLFNDKLWRMEFCQIKMVKK